MEPTPSGKSRACPLRSAVLYLRAGELLGIRKLSTLDMFDKLGIAYPMPTWEEVQQDIANYEAVLQKEHETTADV